MTADANTPGGLPPALSGSGGLDERAWSTWIERAALFALVLTVLKGLRMPSRWAMTHYLITYKIGFVKRGLWGEVLWRVVGRATSDYFVLAAVAFAVFSALLALVVFVLRRLPPSADRAPFLLCFCSLPALSFLTHVVGYAEHLAYLAVVAVITLRRSWVAQVVAATTAAAVVPFVHEAAVLWIGPPLALVLVVSPALRRHPPRARLATLGVLVLTLAASTWTAAIRGGLPREYVDILRDDRTRFASFRPRQDAFEALRAGRELPLATMSQRWPDRETRRQMAYSVAVFGPGAFFLAWLGARRSLRLDASPTVRRAAALLVVTSAAAPLALHGLGWDLERWNADAAISAGLAALVLVGTDTAPVTSARALSRQARALGLALMLAVWGTSSYLVLFDRYAPSYAPFRDRVYFLEQAIKTRDPELWLPMQGN